MTQVSKNDRIINFATDTAVTIIISSILTVTIGQFIFYPFLHATIVFLYYFLFEMFLGQTLGKMVTGTIVRNVKNEKANFIQILMRTLLRFNYFDQSSYLLGNEQGTHDVLSRTRLKMKKQL